MLHKMSAAKRWAMFSMVFALLLTAAKTGAWWITGSAAILSDALESIVNILSSGFVLYAIWLSERPRDADHPYGHGKVEYFSAGFEGALVMAAAVSIGVVGADRLLRPSDIEQLGLGMALQGGISVVTLIAGQAVIRAGRRLQSPSLEADGVHIRSDAITSFGVLVGLALVWITGAQWLDGLCALIVAVWLAFSGVVVVRRAIGGLMDEADPDLLDAIATTIEAVREPGWIAPHHTKVHRLGSTIHIDLHLVFPAFWTIEHVHEATLTIDAALRERFGERTEIMVHPESCRPESCAYCDLPECPIRQHPFIQRNVWDGALFARPSRPVGPTPG